MVIQAYDSENKIRPGVYVKTIVEPNNNANETGLGATAIGLEMSWGEEGTLIEMDQANYFAGNYKSVIGYSLSNTNKTLPYTLALSNCNTAYFYRLNRGGVKATGTLGSGDNLITFNAKYTGKVGNSIKIIITADKPIVGKHRLDVLVDNVKEESYTLSSAADLKTIKSNWINIIVGENISTITTTAGLSLTGGTDGSTTTAGVKASVEVGALKFEAKTAGASGNSLSVVISENGTDADKFDLSIYNGNTEVESFDSLADVAAFLAITSTYVDISNGSGSAIIITAGSQLTGGSDATNYLGYFFDSLTYKHINTIAIDDDDADTQLALANWAIEQNIKGKDIQAVVIDNAADNESIITTKNQGYKVGNLYEVTPSLFTLLVAGARAGCPLNQSLASRTIVNATEIINPVADEDVEELLNQGFFLLTYDIDGTVCIEEDQNSLISYTDDKPEDLKFNQVYAVKAFVNYQTALVFRNYLGKFTNIDSVRKQIKSDIIVSVYDYLLRLGAIEPYDSDSDITISRKDARSALVDEYFQVTQTLTKLFVRSHIKF